jgi:hypothetical protein
MSIPATFIVCPCTLLIAKQSLKGNWTRLNLKGYSFIIIRILGMYTIVPLAEPVRISASIRFFFKDNIFNLVPLHNLGAFRFRIRIIGAPIFKSSLCGKIPDGFNKLKNSVGISIASS